MGWHAGTRDTSAIDQDKGIVSQEASPSSAAAARPWPVSVRTRALMIASQLTEKRREPEDLRAMLVAFAPTQDEQRAVVRAAEEELRAEGRPDEDILRLMSAIHPRGGQAPARAAPLPARDPHVLAVSHANDLEDPSTAPAEEKKGAELAGSIADGLSRLRNADEGRGLRRGAAEEEAAPAARLCVPSQARRQALRAEPKEGGPGLVPGGKAAGFSGRAFVGLTRNREPGKTGREAVLVADDDACTRMMYRIGLRDAGFTVEEAENGIDAWNLIKRRSVRCVVMDMKMPGYHGMQVLERMVGSKIILPVVIVSAFDQLGSEFTVAAYPKLRFLTKPVPPNEVVAAVQASLSPATPGRAGHSASR